MHRPKPLHSAVVYCISHHAIAAIYTPGLDLGLCSIAIMIAIYRRVVPAIAVDH